MTVKEILQFVYGNAKPLFNPIDSILESKTKHEANKRIIYYLLSMSYTLIITLQRIQDIELGICCIIIFATIMLCIVGIKTQIHLFQYNKRHC